MLYLITVTDTFCIIHKKLPNSSIVKILGFKIKLETSILDYIFSNDYYLFQNLKLIIIFKRTHMFNHFLYFSVQRFFFVTYLNVNTKYLNE